MTIWKNKIWVGTTGGSLLSIDPDRGYRTKISKLPGEDSNVRTLIGYADTLFVDVPEQVSFRLDEGFGRQMRPRGFELSTDKYFVMKGAPICMSTQKTTRIVHDGYQLRLRQKLKIPTKRKFRTIAAKIISKKEICWDQKRYLSLILKQRTFGAEHHKSRPNTNSTGRPRLPISLSMALLVGQDIVEKRRKRLRFRN